MCECGVKKHKLTFIGIFIFVCTQFSTNSELNREVAATLRTS